MNKSVVKCQRKCGGALELFRHAAPNLLYIDSLEISYAMDTLSGVGYIYFIVNPLLASF